MFSTSHPASSPPTGTCATHTRTKARSTPRTSLSYRPKGLARARGRSGRTYTRARSPHLRSTATAQTSSDTRLPIRLRTSQYRALRSAYVCAAKATLSCSHPVDIPYSDCFGYNPTDFSDDRGGGDLLPIQHRPVTPPTPGVGGSRGWSGDG